MTNEQMASITEDELRASGVCGVNSFAPDTPIVLADGHTKPISTAKVGDSALATDPLTGQNCNGTSIFVSDPIRPEHQLPATACPTALRYDPLPAKPVPNTHAIMLHSYDNVHLSEGGTIP